MRFSELRRSFGSWDGVLPLLVSAVPLAVRLCLPKDHVAGLVVFVSLPSLAALVRCTAGIKRLQEICDGALPILRQLALAMAIILLFMFEGLVTAMTLSREGEPVLWVIAGAIYLAYLVMITLAFSAGKRRDINEWNEWSASRSRIE